MNLHEVVTRALGNGRFGEHTALVWARVVRSSAGQAHLYEIPASRGWLACMTGAAMYDNVIPTPHCGKKPRAGATTFRSMSAEEAGRRPWTNFCMDCYNNGVTVRTFRGYWLEVSTDAQFENFLRHTEENPQR